MDTFRPCLCSCFRLVDVGSTYRAWLGRLAQIDTKNGLKNAEKRSEKRSETCLKIFKPLSGHLKCFTGTVLKVFTAKTICTKKCFSHRKALQGWPRYDIQKKKSSTKEFCDAIATSIARYEEASLLGL